MEQKFKQHIESILDFTSNPKLLLAVSGGVDSVVLAHLLSKCGYTFDMAHVNYKLRGADSDLDESLVSETAKILRVNLHTAIKPIKPDASGIQEKARNLRYAWFEELVSEHQYDAVLTAHHADDQLETLFMRLSRGSGVEGLSGIRAKNDFLIRPLLPFFKEELVVYAKTNTLKWREDVSNNSTKYLRNNIRHNVMPSFLALSSQTAANTLESVQHLQETFDAISAQVNEIKKAWENAPDGIRIPLISIQDLQPKRFWLHHLFALYGFDAVEVEKLLTKHAGKKCVSATHELLRERDHLVLSVQSNLNDATDEVYMVPENGIEFPVKLEFSTPNAGSKTTANCVLVNASKLTFPLVLRRWNTGDLFYPTGMKGKKKLSKFFKDEKMSAAEKKNQWLLCNEKNVIWVIGKRLDRRYLADDLSNTLQIEIV